MEGQVQLWMGGVFLLITFVNMNDVWMLHRGHDLYFSSDPDKVSLCLDLTLLDCLDRHLKTHRISGITNQISVLA